MEVLKLTTVAKLSSGLFSNICAIIRWGVNMSHLLVSEMAGSGLQQCQAEYGIRNNDKSLFCRQLLWEEAS